MPHSKTAEELRFPVVGSVGPFSSPGKSAPGRSYLRFMNAHNPSEPAPVTALQQDVDQWIQTFGVRYFNELTNMAQLTEEVGEVARIIARRYGEQSEKESDKNKDLGEELADVLFVVLCLANQTGTDLQAAYDRRMEAKGARDKDRASRAITLFGACPTKP